MRLILLMDTLLIMIVVALFVGSHIAAIYVSIRLDVLSDLNLRIPHLLCFQGCNLFVLSRLKLDECLLVSQDE